MCQKLCWILVFTCSAETLFIHQTIIFFLYFIYLVYVWVCTCHRQTHMTEERNNSTPARCPMIILFVPEYIHTCTFAYMHTHIINSQRNKKMHLQRALCESDLAMQETGETVSRARLSNIVSSRVVDIVVRVCLKIKSKSGWSWTSTQWQIFCLAWLRTLIQSPASWNQCTLPVLSLLILVRCGVST